MKELTEKSYWDNKHDSEIQHYDPNIILFKDLFIKYLKHNIKPGMTGFEIGCYPGKYLIYFAKEFKMRVSGIDYTNKINKMKEYLKSNDVGWDDIFCEDLMRFNIKKKYDLVFSSGFIEHFHNFKEIIEKHVELIKPGGYLFITCPNFRKIQYILHSLFDKENLTQHNLTSMDLHNWRNVLENKGMNIIYHDYYRTFYYWYEPSDRSFFNNKMAMYVQSFSLFVDNKINFSNPFTSPYLVSISQKEL